MENSTFLSDDITATMDEFFERVIDPLLRESDPDLDVSLAVSVSVKHTKDLELDQGHQLMEDALTNDMILFGWPTTLNAAYSGAVKLLE
jgi:hypothetical protein